MDPERFWSSLRASGGYATDPVRRHSPFARWLGRRDTYYHLSILRVIVRMYWHARAHRIDRACWGRHQLAVIAALERCGAQIVADGIQNIPKAGMPVVCVSNHMSTIETLCMALFLHAYGDVIVVVKEDLLRYPLFGAILRELGMIAVSRANPRVDFKTVMEQGAACLARGASVIVFPQATRDPIFRPTEFNSIGVKLARHAGVPILPAALLTDFQQPGKWIKDLGRLDRSRPVRFRFGTPFRPGRDSRADHQAVTTFVRNALLEWSPANVADAPDPAP